MQKRLLDIFVSTVALIMLLPIFVAIAVMVKFSSRGPIFYGATRVGRYGKHFTMYKFRSMVVNADKIGAGITSSSDHRITQIGRFLRNSKLDELPQLVNVLRGEMSIVGPRPEDPRYVALYTQEQREVLNVRPGITGLAAVKYRHEELLLTGENWEKRYTEEIMPAKLEFEISYIRNLTLKHDLLILWQTFKALWVV